MNRAVPVSTRRRLGHRSAGSPEASLSARSCLRLSGAATNQPGGPRWPVSRWGLLLTRGGAAQATEREDVRYRSVRRRRRRLCGRLRRAGRWARRGDVDVVPRRGRLRELPRQHVLLSLSRLRGAVRSAVATRPRQTHERDR
eukprot:scaffold48381_cov62-Phaeocystis_antarctica.AAC.11